MWRSSACTLGQRAMHVAVSAGTPLSTAYYLNKEKGESYGLVPTPKLFACQAEWLCL